MTEAIQQFHGDEFERGAAAHIVLDLETLSTKPHAAVISIGAVALDAVGQCVGEFHTAIDGHGQPGRDIDPETLAWWAQQSPEAQAASLHATSCVSATQAMCMFSGWVGTVADPEKVKMWGNGSSFDCTILSSLYAQCHELGHPQPWRWWNDRDMRTISDDFPEAKNVGPFEGIKHHALHDARHEAKVLAKAMLMRELPIVPPGYVLADQAMDVTQLYRDLQDVWAEANAVGTVIGRYPMLMAKLTRLRDAVGSARNGHLPIALARQAAPAASEWDVRGHLAASLTCWHRLTGQEAAELIALFQGHPAQPAPAAAQPPAGWVMVPHQVPDSAFPWVSGGYPAGYKAADKRDTLIIHERAQRTWSEIIAGIAAAPKAEPAPAGEYPPLPPRYYVIGNESVWSADQMRAYVDADRAARAQPAVAQAAPAPVAPQGERQFICPTRTVADLVNNLLTLDQALPIYGAQYIEKDGRRCAIAVPPTVSRERVKDGRWIGQGEELNAAVIWTRAEQPAAVAGPSDARHRALMLAASCCETIHAPDSWDEDDMRWKLDTRSGAYHGDTLEAALIDFWRSAIQRTDKDGNPTEHDPFA
ncbi:MAG: 3'-5' exoribonuclease, partial [Burkholderiaceae bacterium]